MSKKIFNPQDWQSAGNTEPQPAAPHQSPSSSPSNDDIEIITRRIESTATDITSDYADWRDLGFALSDTLGEGGRQYYHRLSRFYSGYTETETDKQFDKCLKSRGHGVTIKTLFHLAKQAGIRVSVSSKSSKSPGEEIKETEELSEDNPESDVQTEIMPTFSESIREDLPGLLAQIVEKSISPEDADLLLLGSITVFSACLPNVYGIYGGREVFPNLFLFVAAQASAGKGRLTLCRHLVEPIHKQLREYYRIEMEEYRRKQAEYVANKKNPDAEQPQEPPLKTLFVPANSSATSVYQVLNDNKGVGLMFETEGDTLANTFKSDYGNFSDGFRKAFHHETISYNRRKDREFVELEAPKFSALLSGTPHQVLSLIPDAENGLFSRFIFYYMNVRLVWNDVFANSDAETLDCYFEQLGKQFHELYKILQGSGPIRFSFSMPQQEQFNNFFDGIQQQYTRLFGLDIVASIRRLGLIAFRIAMILSTLRILDHGDIPSQMVCDDTDFQTVLAMVKVLLLHTAKVFEELLPNSNVYEKNQEKTQIRQKFFDNLPADFDRQIYLSIAEQLKIPFKTAERYITHFCSSNKLIHAAHNKYTKQCK